MKKKILVPIIILLAVTITIIMYITTNHNSEYKTISEIGGFQINDITKISFQYNNAAIKGGHVENKEKINEFMKYLNSCGFREKSVQTPGAGYYQCIVLHTGYKRVMDITTCEKYVQINNIQYDRVKTKLSTKKIDEFIESIKKDKQTGSTASAEVEETKMDKSQLPNVSIDKENNADSSSLKLIHAFLEYYKNNPSDSDQKIKDYRMSTMNVRSSKEDSIIIYCSFTVNPEKQEAWLVPNGEIRDDGWISKAVYMKAAIKDDKVILEEITYPE